VPYAIKPGANARLKAGALAAALLAGSASQPFAQEPAFQASADDGLKLAQTLCTNCHLIDGTSGSSVTVGIPSFSGIANKPGQTGANIERILIAPHAPMPDMKLSFPEIQNLIAYFDSLRTDKSLPPLQPSTKPPEKPKYPTPS
jgi:mono/diheme cytochrome c family protein